MSIRATIRRIARGSVGGRDGRARGTRRSAPAAGSLIERPVMRLPAPRSGTGDRRLGLSLLEVSLAMALSAVLILGVTASLSTAAAGSRATDEQLGSEMLVTRVLEEIQASPWETLPSFHGTFVTEGPLRADIRVGFVNVDLLLIQVDVTSTASTATSRGVLYKAATN